MRFVVDGRAVDVELWPQASLLDVLRERLGITVVKDGCQPQGQCGCCLVLVDGSPKTACAVPASHVEGRTVTTLAGVPHADKQLIADAFASAGGVQCGFCVPGIALRTWSLIQEPGVPDRDRIVRALDGHLCRCTGYQRIVEGIERAARAKWEGVPLPEPDAMGRVGSSPVRYSAEAMVLGERTFVADLKPPGMLYGALRLTDHPRAVVKRIDVDAARQLPGVRAVATANDVPGQRWIGLLHDDWPVFIAEGEVTHCIGSVLAAVAADDPDTARRAAALVAVEYEVLAPVTTPDAALASDAPAVHPRFPNLMSRTVLRRGDAEAALRDSAHVVEGTWQTQRIEHLFLEPEACLAVPLFDGRMRLHTHGQGIFDDRRQCAAVLGVAEADLDVVLEAAGGAFGGKEDATVQPHAALLARITGRPVRVTLTRGQSVRMHPKRHPMKLHYKVGCDGAGNLTAVWARIVGDSGAYASVGAKVLERAAGHATGAYAVPCVDVEAVAVRTNNPPCGAMRGFGANQAQFALEGALDELAERTGIDPWEFRFRNALQAGGMTATGQVLQASVGIRQTLLAVREPWQALRRAGQAVGIACGMKNTGIGNGVVEWGKARLRVERDGTVTLWNGYTEMGQGLFTVLCQVAAEVTGLPFAVFQPRVDSAFQLACGQTTGSRATLFGGNAVKAAAEKLRKDLGLGLTLRDLAGRVYAADVAIADTTSPDAPLPAGQAPKTHTSYGFATQVAVLDARGRLERVIAAHDVGRAINPELCKAQVEGAVHMGLGYALSEELACQDGVPLTDKLKELGVLRASDMPRVDVVLVEDPEPEGPFGAKGVGEIGLVPTAAAVANALFAFDGVRRRRLPMRESPAAQALSVGKKARPGTGWDAR